MEGPRICGGLLVRYNVSVKLRFPSLKFNRAQKYNRGQREPERPSIVMKKGESFRNQRNQQKRQEQMRHFLDVLRQYRLVLIGIVVIIALIAIFAGVSAVLRANDTFVVKTIAVRGNQALTSEEIIAAIPEAMNQTMIAISARGLEQKLLREFPYLKEVYVRKFIPDRLEIEVKERFPVMIYANLSGAVSVDEEGVVLNIFASEQVAELSNDELEIIVGYGDSNANRVKEKYLSSLATEDERQKTKWEEVPADAKQKALSDLRGDYVARFEGQLRKHVNAIPETLRATLPLVQDLASPIYKVGDIFPRFKFIYVQKIQAYFQARAIVPARFLWQTDFNIMIVLPSTTQILFTTSRGVDDQLAALETLRKTKPDDVARARIIDVRSVVVSIK